MALRLFLILAVLGIVSAKGPHFLGPRNALTKSSLQVKDYPGQCAANDQTKTKACLDSYFKTYGYDTSTGLPDYLAYVAMTDSLISNYGVSGIDFYCDFEATLETCLGPLLTSACMNPDAFARMYGTNETESANYATNFAVESYGCQYKDLEKSYYPCMQDMEKNDGLQGLFECMSEMAKEMEGTGDMCVSFDHYVACVENYYVKFCDEGIRSFICNTEEIAINFANNNLCQSVLHKCD